MNTGKYSKFIEKFTDVKTVNLDEKINLDTKDFYEFSPELNKKLLNNKGLNQVKKNKNKNNTTLNLFILDKQIYSVDENAVKNISHQFEDEETLRKYL